MPGPIELKTLQRRLPTSQQGVPTTVPPKRRGVFGSLASGVGWLATGPLEWAGLGRIRRTGAFIRDMSDIVREGPPRDNRFHTGEAGSFDLRATASSYGLNVDELRLQLALRRRQTARMAYVTLAIAMLFLLAWFWEALSAPLSAGRVASMIHFLPFSVLFFLLSFHSALLNFQIRVSRLASWREYLMTDEAFWPT